MKRRDFVKLLAVIPGAITALDLKAAKNKNVDYEGFIFELGYNREERYTWLRTSRWLPDGQEWHDMCYKYGGDYRKDAQLMFKSAEIVWQKKLREYD